MGERAARNSVEEARNFWQNEPDGKKSLVWSGFLLMHDLHKLVHSIMRGGRSMKPFLILGLLVILALTGTAYALDGAAWQAVLTDLADGISQTAYTLSEKAGSAEREAARGGNVADRAGGSSARARRA